MPSAPNARIHYLVLTLCLVGCGQSSPRSEDASVERDAAKAPVRGREGCEEFQTDANELLDSAQACATDEDCNAAKDFEAACLDAFLCPVSVANTADLERLRSEAHRLSNEFRACTPLCAIADCGSVVGATGICNSSTMRCEVKVRPPASAGTGAQRN